MQAVSNAAANPHPSAPIGGELEFGAVLALIAWSLWRHRRRLMWWSLLGLLLATVNAFSTPNIYESTASLMPPDEQALSGGAMLAAIAGSALPTAGSSLVGSFLGGQSAGATFVGILQSRTAEDDIVKRYDLLHAYRAKQDVDARRRLAQNTNVREDLKTRIISITVSDTDPQRAKVLASAYVDELNMLVNQLSTSSARRERIFLEGRLKAVNQDLNAVSTQLSQFSSRNRTLDMESQGKATLEAVGKLQGEFIATESQLRGLQSIYAPDNARVRAVQARADELRRQLQKMGGVGNESSNADAKGGELYPSLRELPLLGVTYYDLYRRMTIQEAVYKTLTEQCELAKVEEAKEIPAVKVLDEPVVPERKSSPHRSLMILMGAFLGWMLAAISVYVEDYWRAMDAGDPRKGFTSEVVRTVREGAVKWAPGPLKSLLGGPD